MSTNAPETLAPAPAPAETFAESDKLGPLGARASVLRDAGALRAKLLGEFQAAVGLAAEAVQLADKSTTEAVHESRKALRRARAVLSLISHALPKSERRAVKSALQESRRSLSTVRDHAVAPETLGEMQLDDENRDTGKRVLDNAAEAVPPTAEIKQLLTEAATRAAAQAEALEAALPPELAWSTIADGLAEVYGNARKARSRSRRSKQWFHTWRRRTKELGYQLELISELAGPRTLAVKSEFEAVSDVLGPAVDRIMLREFVETHGLGVPPDALNRLRDAIDGQLDDLMKMARKTAKDSFTQKPSKFARRVGKTVKRDLAPPDDAGDAAPDNA